MSWIKTYTGRKFEFGRITPDDIDIVDIAHSLSHLCRFNGHSRYFYSVAEHSIEVSHRVPPELALVGLLHDAHEAYMGDITRPLKKKLSAYFSVLQQNIDLVIAARFGFDFMDFHSPAIREVDNRMLATEGDLMMGGREGWDPLPEPYIGYEPYYLMPRTAKNAFRARFAELTSGK